MTTEEEHRKLAERYIEASNTERIWVRQFDDLLFKIACNTDPKEAEDLQILKRELTWEKFKSLIIDVVVETYPPNVLSDWCDFYETESGKFISNANIAVTAKYLQKFECLVNDVVGKMSE